MAHYSDICKAAAYVKKRYEEKDMFRICSDMGISVLRKNFGTSPNAVKGFFYESKQIKTITVNSDLPAMIQRIIVAHELGHALLHAKGVHGFRDFSMFDETSVLEKEANLFAAEYLLDDSEVLDALNVGATKADAASLLMVPEQLLDFKFMLLKWKGCPITETSLMAKNNFLLDMDLPVNDDDHIC